MITGMNLARRRLIILTAAALIAVMTTFGPVMLELAGIEVGATVYACSHQSGSGDC